MTATARWPKATKARPCPICGHTDRCNIAPDGTAAVCWRNGGKSIQVNGYSSRAHNGINNGCATGYVGAAHRKPADANSNGGKVFTTADEAIAAAGRNVKGGTLATVWVYRFANGAEVMHVARFNLAGGSKQFRPVHHSHTGWKIGDPPGPLPLYRLDELPASGAIYVCEGEKATDAARLIGLPATTSSHGSSAADKSDWTPLAGRTVFILMDNDDAGRKYGQHVAGILIGLDCRVKIISLPELPDGGDIVEFIEARDSQESEAIAAEVIALAESVPFIDAAKMVGGPVLTCMADVQPRAVQWLWPARIPMARLTVLAGRPGLGKSFLTTDMAARVTTGTPWPDGNDCPTGSVILIVAEDDAADTIRPRLDAHHADVRRVHLLSMVRRIGEDGKRHEILFTLADVPALETALRAHPDCKLIVVDPIGSFIGGKTDAHRENEVRAVLSPVAKLAEQYGVAVLLVAHLRKNSGGNADQAVLGSTGFIGIARAAWHLSRDPQMRERRLLLPGKNNLAREGDGLAFTIIGDPAAIQWEREPVRMSADDAMQAENDGGTPGPEPEARNAAVEWLRELLASGPVPSGDLKAPAAGSVRASAKAADIAWRTVRRAADSIGVRHEKCPHTGVWQWRLPKPGNQLGQVVGQYAAGVDNLDNMDNIEK